jgi:hypothetical protein
METDQLDPKAALAAISKQRHEAAERLVTPWWYHPVLGLLVGGYVVAQTVDSVVVRLVAVAVLLVGLAVLVRAYRRLTGLWVSGYRRGPAGRITLLLAAVYVAAVLVAVLIGNVAASLVAGAAVVVLTVVLGRRFDEALQEELRT